MTDEVQMLFTMDVEPVTSGAGRTSGPASLAEGLQRVREYAEVLGARGYTPTFFVHPDVGDEAADLLLALQRQGACLGLHLHTVKFGAPPAPCELGGLPPERQREIIEEAAARFTRSFGFRPRLFRPGCFAASDATFGVLHELGFTGGSVSIPGRVWPERCCVWAGAAPHPHYAHEAFRQLPGSLPFVEIPLSVDRIGGLRTHPLGFQHYLDLRPGGVYSDEEDSGRDHRLILRHITRQLADERPSLPTIVIDVHNDRPFADLATTPARQLRTTLDALAPELEIHGLRPVDATFDRAVARYHHLAQQMRSKGSFPS